MKKYLTNTSSETKKLGAKFAKTLRNKDIILLYGALGAGKTTFVQGIAEGLGVTDRILSPTFVLQRSHKVRSSHFENLNHIDLYRIEGVSQVQNLGLSVVIKEDKSITLIEWADKLSGFDHKKGYKVYFKYLNENEREIRIVPMVVSIRDPARMKFVGKKV